MYRKNFSIWLNPRISVPPWNWVSYGSRPSMGNLGRVRPWRHFENESVGCQSGLLLCVSVEAFLPHKFFAGAPQSTDFCFYQQYLLLRRVRKWALTPGLWLRRLRNLLYRWREWRLALINNAKWIVKRWRPSWFICWQLSGQRRMDSQMRWMLTKNSNELWWTDPKAMICRSQRVILVRL